MSISPRLSCGRAGDVAGQQNRARAGAEDGLAPAERGQRLEQPVVVQQLEHGGALAAGQDQSIEIGQLLALAD